VVMGGPMNVDQVDRYPFLAAEVGWIREGVAQEIPMMGICLGAQLLAKSLGAKVFANPVKEIGWYEIELLPAAAGDPLFRGCPARQTVFQWHGDTFEMPSGAVHLARSTLCRHQAFRYGPSAFGLQFHAEMTEDMVDDWLDNPENRCELAGLDYVDPAAIRAQTRLGLLEMQRLGDQILPRFAELCVRRAAVSP
jgi:GMP synthase (glutamine-hydrolysing)